MMGAWPLPWRPAVTMFLAVISVAALWATGIDPAGVLASIYWPGIFVLQLTVVTAPWRAVPVGRIGLMFLLGMSVVPAVTLAAQAGMYALVNTDPVQRILVSEEVLGNYDLMAPVVAPITEELLKIAPLVVFLSWGRRAAWRRILGPLDLALLAGASGAGFEFVENLLRVADGYWAPLGVDRVVPVASPILGPFHLFPDMIGSTYFGVDTVWFGHGEMSAWVGLAIGLGLFLGRKLRFWWLLPSAALAWATWDHFLVNYLGPAPSQAWAQVLPALDLYGGLLPYVFLAALVFSIFLASRTQSWYLSLDRGAAADMVSFGLLGSLITNPRLAPGRVAAIWRFWRLRRGVGYGMRDFVQAPPRLSVHCAAWLEALREEMLGQKRLVSEDRAVK